MMEKKMERRGLGRGLSALMADVRLDQTAADGAIAPDRLLATDRLIANPNQPRRTFEPSALKDLADSLRKKGIIQPLIVRPTGNPEQFEIVAGERRWRAAQMAQIHQVPVIVRELDDTEVLEIAIIENVQRADLSAIEEAQAYRQLMDRFGHTQEKIAEALSKSRSHIANILRLLALPQDVQSMVEAGTLTAGHARALITTPNATELARQVVGRGLTVRQTEALVRKSAVPAAARARLAGMREKDADTRVLEGDLSANLKMGVTINHEPGGERGRLTITYNTLDDLDMLCRVLSQASRDALG
ncbi:ParB/RepB/Spo0J family partition protein [Tabrizicola fusiformis]|uniref:ParB/RepB/Spo0J family partition protein n=1 Tax=Tabrizicola sp. SY72 TaxID=2741673 RepID=UPI00157409A0|nr:ParB/RepB/Spo0J family partition protein [Tabrizicola sp. SY72]NTT87106.1 ParB/RepB/Spo0J family partition protein [Tabrizicola sp. SY72]